MFPLSIEPVPIDAEGHWMRKTGASKAACKVSVVYVFLHFVHLNDCVLAVVKPFFFTVPVKLH